MHKVAISPHSLSPLSCIIFSNSTYHYDILCIYLFIFYCLYPFPSLECKFREGRGFVLFTIIAYTPNTMCGIQQVLNKYQLIKKVKLKNDLRSKQIVNLLIMQLLHFATQYIKSNLCTPRYSGSKFSAPRKSPSIFNYKMSHIP